MPSVNLYNEDCIAGLSGKVGDATVHLTVTSIPFRGTLYVLRKT
jgi:hypothetical protein